MFRRAGSDEAFRGGVAIGDRIVAMAALAARGGKLLDAAAANAVKACAQPALNDFSALDPAAWRTLLDLLESGAPADGRMFGVCLLNDWSARDLQWREMPPLGPFLAEHLATSMVRETGLRAHRLRRMPRPSAARAAAVGARPRGGMKR